MPPLARHESVLAEEVLEWLAPAPGQAIVDGTLGAAGHAVKILEKMGRGLLIGFDRDAEAVSIAEKELARFGDRYMIIRENFKNMAQELEKLGIERVDGILLDLGVSSMQLDEAARGFSFREKGPLDMRMDASQKYSAYDVINFESQEVLERMFWDLGEERFGRQIARKIVEYRKRKKIDSTEELASVVSSAVPSFYRHGRIHPATKTFQALRIFVNEELHSLQFFLNDAPNCLKNGGRLCVISFHSLEDRIVKNAFKKMKTEGKGNILTKKPLIPTDAETDRNPRARSAKMRVFERFEEASR